MNANKQKENGLFWTPLGGNNPLDIWASCHLFQSKTPQSSDTILVDIGRHERPKTFLNNPFDCVVPDLSPYLDIPLNTPPTEPAKAIFLTHAHTDHIDGIYEYVRMGTKLPPIYASEFTINMIKKGMVEKEIDWNLMPEFHAIKSGDQIKIGEMTVLASNAPHSIPGSFSYKIENPQACLFHSGDIKADPTSFLDKEFHEQMLQDIASARPIDLMTFDATATHMDGFARQESDICDTYTDLFTKYADQQLVAPISAGHMERLASVVKAAENAGKHVIINGGSSMQSHLMGLAGSGLRLEKLFPNIKVLSYKNPEVLTLPPQNTVTITTGIYGNADSPFVRALNNEKINFTLADNAVLIAPLIGDKYETLSDLIKNSTKAKSMTLITANDVPGLYGSGHAQKEDFKYLAELLKPQTVAPIHCSVEMANTFNDLARKEGYKALEAQVSNGQTVRVTHQDGVEVVKTAPAKWFGLTHTKDEFGSIQTQAVKITDLGDIFQTKRIEADKKIAEYKSKKRIAPLASVLQKKAQRGGG